MSRHAASPETQAEEPRPEAGEQKPALTLIEFPAPPDTPALDEAERAVNRIAVEYESAGYAAYERGSLLRIFRREFRDHVSRLTSGPGSRMSLEDACRVAAARYDVKGAAELMEGLLKVPFESVDFADLSRLWECSPEEAERYFELVKHEAQREFETGHLAAKVFEPVDWLRSVWGRAQFLAIRDTFIVEYGPEGGIEYALIDTLCVCFFMQQYWSEAAVKRTRTDPRRESEEYTQWKTYKRAEAKARRYEHGHWDIPLASEDRAVRTTAEMMDHFSRLFQRALRQLNGHRLAKLKALKLRAEIRRLGGEAGEHTEGD